MTTSKQRGQHGERGIPGLRGRRGKQGSTGADGKAGNRGPQGARGATRKTGSAGKLSPSDRREVLNLVHGQITEVSRELQAQMKRLASLKGELDELRTNVANLIDSAS